MPSLARQSDKNLGQSVRLKKDAYIVAPNNSLFGEILRVDFEFFLDYAGREQQNLRKIPLQLQNLRKISGNLNEILIFDNEEAERNGTSRAEKQGHPIF